MATSNMKSISEFQNQVFGVGNFHIYLSWILFFFPSICSLCLNIRNEDYWNIKIKESELTNQPNKQNENNIFLSKDNIFSLSPCEQYIFIAVQLSIVKYFLYLTENPLSSRFISFTPINILKSFTGCINLIDRCPSF